MAAEFSPIYLDHHATTPCDPRVVEAMLPMFAETFGNAASAQHAAGRAAARHVERARAEVADLLAADPREIVFTSGATESNNLALKGVMTATGARGRHLVTCGTEHKAVLDTCARLEEDGFEVTYLGVDADGTLDLDRLENAIRDETALVSLMYANNEIGTVHPLREISAICRRHGTLLHSDAAQAGAHLPLGVDELGVDLLSLSAHKMYGPKGVGALYVRRRRPRVRLRAQIDGGGHERGLRSGTLNVPGIVGFGCAAAIVAEERDRDSERISKLRDRLWHRLRTGLEGVTLHGTMTDRLPNNLSVGFGVHSEDLLRAIPSVAVSSGAACSSAKQTGSYVLQMLYGSSAAAEGSLRFGLGRTTTPDEIERAADSVIAAVTELRARPRSAPRADHCLPTGER